MRLKKFFIRGVIKAVVEDDLASGNKVGQREKGWTGDRYQLKGCYKNFSSKSQKKAVAGGGKGKRGSIHKTVERTNIQDLGGNIIQMMKKK